MPFYIYKCKKCNTEIEIKAPIEHKIPECPKCGNKMEIIIQPVQSIFRGTGFPGNDLKRYNQWKKGELDDE